MARFDVYSSRSHGRLLDCQSDLLSRYNTRFVVPLRPLAVAPPPVRRLNPVFDVGGERVVMLTQFAAAIPVRDLGDKILSLIDDEVAIGIALDMLLFGF